DGIRDWSVTGVQTCALPISQAVAAAVDALLAGHRPLGRVPELWDGQAAERIVSVLQRQAASASARRTVSVDHVRLRYQTTSGERSEERRVGKGGGDSGVAMA